MIETLSRCDVGNLHAVFCAYDLLPHQEHGPRDRSIQLASKVHVNCMLRSWILCDLNQRDNVMKYFETKYFPNIKDYI